MSGAGGREEGRSRRRLQETPRQEERQEERGPARPGQDRAGRGGGRAVLTPEAGRSTLGAAETMSQTHGLFLVNEEAWASGSRRGANGPQAGVSGQAGRVARNPGRGGSPAGRGRQAAPPQSSRGMPAASALGRPVLSTNQTQGGCRTRPRAHPQAPASRHRGQFLPSLANDPGDAFGASGRCLLRPPNVYTGQGLLSLHLSGCLFEFPQVTIS